VPFLRLNYEFSNIHDYQTISLRYHKHSVCAIFVIISFFFFLFLFSRHRGARFATIAGQSQETRWLAGFRWRAMERRRFQLERVRLQIPQIRLFHRLLYRFQRQHRLEEQFEAFDRCKRIDIRNPECNVNKETIIYNLYKVHKSNGTNLNQMYIKCKH